MSSLMLIRPKSIATVVVLLPSTPLTSSMPTPALVSTSSVCRGRISLTALTSVVLPTPNPPAMRIFTASGMCPSERSETIDNRLEDAIVGPLRPDGLVIHRFVHLDQSLLEQVTQQDAHHAEREIEVCGELRDRDRLAGAGQDGVMLGLQVPGAHPVGGVDDERDQVEAADDGPGPSTGHRVGTHHRPGVGVEPVVITLRHRT